MSAKATSEELTDEEWLAEHILSPEDAWRLFDTQARERLGISGEEFLRKLDAGEIVNDDTDWNVTEMVAMTPLVRHIEL